jgi:pimeloyl-ACP methyl ester carboxylesterase
MSATQIMNEASSKYVDQIAVEKLINEKLRVVSHAPHGRAVDPAPFSDFNLLPPLPAKVTASNVRTRRSLDVELEFDSPVRSPYPENNRVRCRVRRAAAPRASIVLVHGLFEENLEIYDFFISMLGEQGCDVYLLILPYHYHRKPVESAFSGEYFWSADLARSAQAFKQAVYDLRQLVGHVAATSPLPLRVAGFSMGAGVALALAARMEFAFVFAINPVCNMSELVWESALFSTIRRDLEAAGLGLADARAAYAPFEPLAVRAPATPAGRIAVARSIWDQINDPANYEKLIDTWGIRRVYDYRAGHLNILRVPRLASDIMEASDLMRTAHAERA